MRPQAVEGCAPQPLDPPKLLDVGERARGDDPRGQRRAHARQLRQLRLGGAIEVERLRWQPGPRAPDRCAWRGRARLGAIEGLEALDQLGLGATPVIDAEAGARGTGEEQDEQELMARVERHARTIARGRRRG